MSEPERKLQYLVPKEEPAEPGFHKQCNVCKGHHALKQMEKIGFKTDLGFWFLCKQCNTALLLTHSVLKENSKSE